MEVRNTGENSKLQYKIDAVLSSLHKRGLTYTVQVHSDKASTVTVFVSGREGIGQINLCILYNELTMNWEAHTNNLIYVLGSSFSQLPGLIRKRIATVKAAIRKY